MSNQNDIVESIRSIREKIKLLQSSHGADGVYQLTRGQKGAIVGMLNKMMGGDLERRLTIGLLFGDSGDICEMSSKELSEEQWTALYKWIGFLKVDDEWTVSLEFKRDVATILTYIVSKSDECLVPPKVPNSVSQLLSLGGVVTDISVESVSPYDIEF